MNTSQNNKIVLEPLREVPQEVIFSSESAKRDQNKPNRYHFTFPEQWANQINKDSIIGFRSFYIQRSQRYIEFGFGVSVGLWEGREEKDQIAYFARGGVFSTFLGSDDHISKLCVDWRNHWIESSYLIINPKYEEEGTKYHDQLCKPNLVEIWHDKDALFIGRDPNNKIGFVELKLNEEGEPEFVNIPLELGIVIKPLSNDCIELFGTDEELHTKGEFAIGGVPNIWSRRQLYLTSSISANAENNFLGYTRNNFTYVPIKYFRLTNDDKTFWIDIWDNRDHDVPVILNSLDKNNKPKDKFYAEALVCFNANAML